MPLYGRCCSVLAVPSLLAQAHETNSWWQTHHTPFPQFCQHKRRCSCSVVKELTQLKVTWQKPNHHFCLPVSLGWASTPSQREAVQTLHQQVKGWIHSGTGQVWEGRGGTTVNQYLPQKVKYSAVWNYSLNILCLKMTIKSLITDEVTKGTLDHDLFRYQGPIKTKRNHENCSMDKEWELWFQRQCTQWSSLPPGWWGEGRESCSAYE